MRFKTPSSILSVPYQTPGLIFYKNVVKFSVLLFLSIKHIVNSTCMSVNIFVIFLWKKVNIPEFISK